MQEYLDRLINLKSKHSSLLLELDNLHNLLELPVPKYSPLIIPTQFTTNPPKTIIENDIQSPPIKVIPISTTNQPPLKKLKYTRPIPKQPPYKLYYYSLSTSELPISSLIPCSKKYISTNDHLLSIHEQYNLKLIKNIQSLQESNTWSFRQLLSLKPPPRPKYCWDYLLEEMAWLATDFRQERKWKLSMALIVANWVLDWHASGAVLRSAKNIHKSKPKIELFKQNNSSVHNLHATLKKNSTTDVNESILTVNTIIPSQISLEITPETVSPNTQEISEFPVILPPPSNSISISINFDSLTYSSSNNNDLDDNNMLLPDMNIYDYPTPKEDDMVEFKPSIAPVSKLMLNKYHGHDVKKWDQYGRLKTLQNRDEEFIWLNGSKKYDIPLVSVLFGKKDDRTIVEPLTLSNDYSTLQEVPWSQEEDDALFSLANYFQNNWSLLSDSLKSLRLNWIVRSEHDCYDRFNTLCSKGFKPEIEIDVFLVPCKSSKVKTFLNMKSEMSKTRKSKFITSFDTIRRICKKRDSAVKPVSANKPSKNQIHLSSHETHYQSQSQAGIDFQARPLSPIELSFLKDQRERELRHAQEQHKHAGLFPGNLGRNLTNMSIARNSMQFSHPRSRQSFGAPTPSNKYGTIQKSEVGLAIQNANMSANFPSSSTVNFNDPKKNLANRSFPGNFAPTSVNLSNKSQGQFPGSSGTLNNNNFGLQNNNNILPSAKSPVEAANPTLQQVQTDAQTAAALIALQNGQNAVKGNNASSSGTEKPFASPSRTSLRKKK